MSGQRAVRLWSPVARRWLTVLAVATAAGAMALVSASPARSVATTLTLTPTADAYVDSSKPTTNFGAAPQLQQDAASASKMISFLTFTVTGLTGAPTSAVLNLMSRSTGVTKTQVLAASTAWSENTVTWNNQPPVGSLISTTGALTSGAVISADVTRAVTGNGVYTFALETGATAVRYDDSREAVANTPTPPSLVVSYDAPTSTPTSSSPPTSSTPTTSTPTTSTPTTSSPPTSSTPTTTTPTTSTPDSSTPDTSTPASTTPAPSTSDSSTSPTPTTSTSTSTPPPPDPVVMVAGDIACAPNDPNFNALNGMPGYCHMKTTAALEKTLVPTAVLALGDEQYNSGNPNDFRLS